MKSKELTIKGKSYEFYLDVKKSDVRALANALNNAGINPHNRPSEFVYSAWTRYREQVATTLLKSGVIKIRR